MADATAIAVGSFQLLVSSAPDGIMSSGTVEASYSLGFSLTDPMEYDLGLGIWGTANQAENQLRPASITAVFSGGGLFYRETWRGPQTLTMPSRGILPIGDYNVSISFVAAAVEGIFQNPPLTPVLATGVFSLGLELTPVAVPEPGTLSLVGVSLTALLRRSRRRRHASTR